MNSLALQLDSISKKYSINIAKSGTNTLRDQLADALKCVFKRNGSPKQGKEDVWVLQNITFEVPQGEVLGIIGRNGAGKSTLLKVLSRITAPTKGFFRSYGRIGSLLEVGTGFHPELTGRENIFLNGAILGMGKREIKRKFDEIVAFAETGRFIDTPVKRYSSGMYVRLAFAVAAHLEPEILLVDEVLAVGDANFQKKCLGKMSDVGKEGRTILFVSHNMVAVNSLCKRVIWLNDGKIEDDGPSEKVVRNYLGKSLKGRGLPEESWDDPFRAPGNDMVRLRRVLVRPEKGDTSDPLTMETPLKIEIEFLNLIPDAHLHVTLHVCTADGLVAFTTGSILDPAWRDRAMPLGRFRSTCRIPGNLLNSGQHRLVILVVRDTSNVIYTHESGVSFDILDLREREIALYSREPGVVQPILQWGTEFLG